MNKIIIFALCFTFQLSAQGKKNPAEGIFMDKVEKTDKEWQACLTPAEYQILRENMRKNDLRSEVVNSRPESGVSFSVPEWFPTWD